MNCDEKEPERQTKKPQENKTSPTRKRANTTHVPESDTTLSGKRKRLHSRGTPSSAYIPSNAAVSFIEDRSALPFPGASRRFYQRQNKTTSANMKRTRQREQQPVIRDETKNIGMQRSRVEGSLEENIRDTERELLTCKNLSRRAERLATVDIGRELQRRVLLETSAATEIYQKTKASILNEEERTYSCPVYTYEKSSKKLNIVQIYNDQKAYLVEGKDTDIEKVVDVISRRLIKINDNAVKGIVKAKLTDSFADILQTLDSKRDRDILEAIIPKITSVKSVVPIKGVQFKDSVSKHRATLNTNLKTFKDIKVNSQSVRNDMTVTQQLFCSTEDNKLKEDNMNSIAEGRGRKLKCEEFPELARYIEFAFGEGDRILRGGGGLQEDPRLIDPRLFKAADNATVMRDVKEMLKTVKPEFSISTSCLYTYTKNYRKGTLQAKRYHHGREINANVSLHKAPNTLEQLHPLNSHWTTSNVNYLVDSASENPSGFFLDSKGAKCIVCGDIPPVLKPGKTWKTYETPDHTFDQSGINAVTPMTHLFMDIKQELQLELTRLFLFQKQTLLSMSQERERL